MKALKRYRTYCKTCKDFTIHIPDNTGNLFCECGTEEDGYNPNEVEEDLLLKQQERYKNQRSVKLGSLYNSFMLGYGIHHLMALPELEKDIVECDAGLKEIEERKEEEREKVKQEIRNIKEEYKVFYKHLQRNDKCSCGSGLKYKKCHLQYFNNFINT